MSSICSSAPGKLVLLGEYSVLFGDPAVVMAVDRRARVELAPHDGDHWIVTAPGYQEDPVAFDLNPESGLRWREPESDAAGRFALVDRVVSSLVVSKLIDTKAIRRGSIVLDTREFFQPTAGESVKLGLGSSAALTVSLTATLLGWTGGERQPDAIDLTQVLDLHRSFQGGRGSGIDLAASLMGGVVEYRLRDDGRSPSAQHLQLPDGLHMVVLWTGRSVSTAAFLARLDEELRINKNIVEPALVELGQLSKAGIAHLKAADTASLLDDLSEFREAMKRLGRATGIPILSDEHLRLEGLARDCGVRYKPSGAGGGDVGIGLTDDPDAAVAFRNRAVAAGFNFLDLHVDPHGCRVNPR